MRADFDYWSIWSSVEIAEWEASGCLHEKVVWKRTDARTRINYIHCFLFGELII